jgi:hypothetical protein
MCPLFPHPLFILLDWIIPRRYKAPSYANFCKLLSLLPTSSQIFSFFSVTGHILYPHKTTSKMTFLCSFNIHILRQKMGRSKFVNSTLLSIPQIKSVLNFFVIQFWCINIVLKYMNSDKFLKHLLTPVYTMISSYCPIKNKHISLMHLFLYLGIQQLRSA